MTQADEIAKKENASILCAGNAGNADKGKTKVSEEEEKLHFKNTAQQQARSALKAGNTEDAVVLLAEALQLSVEMYGELGIDAAESYVEYGRALLTRHQESADVFGDKDVSKLAQKPAADVRLKKEEDDAADAKEEEEEEEEGEDVGNDDDDDDDDDEEEEADVDLAWSMFDICRVIYEREGVDKNAESLADVHGLLGDVQLEKEKFEEGAEEYKRALELLTAVCRADEDRRVAELHYKTCLALQFAERPGDALAPCEAAVAIFRRRIARVDMSDAEKKDHTQVLAELELKVDEVKEAAAAMRTTKAAVKAALAGMMGSATGGGDAHGIAFASTSGAPATTNTTQSGGFDKPVLGPSNVNNEMKGNGFDKPVLGASGGDGGSGFDKPVLSVAKRRITPVAAGEAPTTKRPALEPTS